MNLRFVRIISDSREDLLQGRAISLDVLRSLRERRGEMIAAVDPAGSALLGWIGVYPDRDEGGHWFHLADIDVLPGHRGEGIDAALMEEAEKLIRQRKASRLKFGTSPLLTGNAALYVTRFGTRYRWREGTRTPEGRPWPYVSCEWDFDDPVARPLDLRADEVVPRSVIDWAGMRPVPRRKIAYSGPLSILLPDLTSDALVDADMRDPLFLSTLYQVFHTLFLHGYDFAWFDRLSPSAALTDGPRCYYVMKRVLAL
jgi:GNAT superfamily N-acetyltransferase